MRLDLLLTQLKLFASKINMNGKVRKEKNILSRLAAGEVILGDGSYIFTLERRGYATAGMWTPESARGSAR